MAFLRTFVWSVAYVGLGAASLRAQTTHARVLVAPQGRARIAAIAPPPPPPRPSSFDETVFAALPVVVLPDGRVLVDLGNSYEQVARTCSYAYGYGCVTYAYPVVSQTMLFYGPPTYVTPVYTPPIYGVDPYYVLAYPPGGYVSYSSPAYYYPPPTYYAGCSYGYGYPPCFNPYPTPTMSVPAGMGTLHAAPARTAPTTLRTVHK